MNAEALMRFFVVLAVLAVQISTSMIASSAYVKNHTGDMVKFNISFILPMIICGIINYVTLRSKFKLKATIATILVTMLGLFGLFISICLVTMFIGE